VWISRSFGATVRGHGANLRSSCPTRSAIRVHFVAPVHNPFRPGAGRRPPALAGRDGLLAAFDTGSRISASSPRTPT